MQLTLPLLSGYMYMPIRRVVPGYTKGLCSSTESHLTRYWTVFSTWEVGPTKPNL